MRWRRGLSIGTNGIRPNSGPVFSVPPFVYFGVIGGFAGSYIGQYQGHQLILTAIGLVLGIIMGLAWKRT